MTITIWNKTININNKLVEEFKKCGHQFEENAAMTLAYSSGANEKSNKKELEKAIEEGLIETIKIEKDMPWIYEEIRRKSLEYNAEIICSKPDTFA